MGRCGHAVAATAAVVAAAYAYAVGLAVPQVDRDVYHLPRVLLWAHEGAVGYVAHAPDVRPTGHCRTPRSQGLATMLVSGSDANVWLVQFAAAAAVAVAGSHAASAPRRTRPSSLTNEPRGSISRG